MIKNKVLVPNTHLRAGLFLPTPCATLSISFDRDVSHISLSLPLREARESFEREYMRSQLDKFEGNVSQMAKFVGMERSALHRKLKTLGLQTP